MSWNFSLILFVLLLATGLLWMLDKLFLRRARKQASEAALAKYRQAQARDPHHATYWREEAERLAQAPWWVEYAASFFPMVLLVFALRSFVIEPFRIPSGSMLPTLEAGDMIVVNKFSYGIRLPLLDKKIIETGSPARGDVMVFRYPREPEIDYIKRVVGLPGDEVSYIDKRLSVNGVEVARARDGDYFEPDQAAYTARYTEQLGERAHHILLNERGYQALDATWRFPGREHCEYLDRGVRCRVPAGHYFMMGDNRDNSLDSRYWGFVPDEHVVGKAFFIWMNFRKPGRIGSFE